MKNLLLGMSILFSSLISIATFASNDLVGTKRDLVTYNQTGAVWTVEFDETTMFSKFCNNVSVGYTYSGWALLASGVWMSTLMYCEGLPMVLENAFQINDSAAVMMSDSILTITTSWNNVFIFEKQTPTICTLEYMPVCGIDWVTYGNACAAAAAKIAVKSEWECVISESCIQKFDGCNMCTREPWGEWACTEMYCETPEAPYCMATSNDEDISVWSDKDEHGCIGSAWYSWSQSSQQCVRVWENTGATSLEIAYDFGFNQGMTTMQSTQEYRANDAITRQEAAKMFVTLAEKTYWKSYGSFPEVCNTPYKDESLFDPTLKSFIYDACAHEIMKWSKGTFMPNDLITKWQAIAVMMRIVDGRKTEQDTATRWMPYAEQAKNSGLITFENYTDFDQAISRGALIEWAYTIYTNSLSK